MKNSILRNSVFMAMFNLFGRASGFIRYMLLVGFLSTANFSIVTYAFAIGKIGRHFIDGGLDNLVSRDGSRDYGRVPGFYVNAMAIKSALAALFFAGIFFYLRCFRGISWLEISIVYIALCGSALTSFVGVIRSCFTAIERMEYVFYTTLPSRLASIALLFLALWLALPLEYAVAAISFENALWFVLLGAISLRFFAISYAMLSWKTIGYMLSESWALALYGFFTIFYLSLDVLMIEYLMGSREHVGPYTYASLLVEGVSLLVSSYFIAVYPRLSQLYESDFKAYKKLFRLSFIALFAFTIPVSVLMGFWADVWMNIIKQTGDVSTLVLQLLAINLNLSMINTFLIIVFTSCNRQRLLVVFTGIAVAVSFASNWVLIQHYSQPGAAAASILSQILLLVIMGATAKKLFQIDYPIGKPLALAAACIGSAFAARYMVFIPPLAQPAFYAVFLAASVYYFRIITLEEMRKMMRSMRK